MSAWQWILSKAESTRICLLCFGPISYSRIIGQRSHATATAPPCTAATVACLASRVQTLHRNAANRPSGHTGSTFRLMQSSVLRCTKVDGTIPSHRLLATCPQASSVSFRFRLLPKCNHATIEIKRKRKKPSTGAAIDFETGATLSLQQREVALLRSRSCAWRHDCRPMSPLPGVPSGHLAIRPLHLVPSTVSLQLKDTQRQQVSSSPATSHSDKKGP